MNHTAALVSLATSVPPHQFHQKQILDAATALLADRYPQFETLSSLFANTGIHHRYAVKPMEWYLKHRGWPERTEAFLEGAESLFLDVARKAIARADLDPSDIDTVVTVCSSGIATPTLDARIAGRMGFRADVSRVPVFGLGCAGGVIGLARTAQLAQGAPQKCYLYLVVELCGLNFLYSDRSKSNIIATALFADGAAAAVISCKGSGPEISAWSEHTWPDSLEVMGWDVVDDGLKAVFSRDIPSIVRNDMGAITQDFLATYGIGTADISGFLCHPGGAKVLDAIEDALGLAQGSLAHSRDVLRRFGNMSAATVMFVMEEARKDRQRGRYLVTAFGPGFTAAFLLLSVQ